MAGGRRYPSHAVAMTSFAGGPSVAARVQAEPEPDLCPARAHLPLCKALARYLSWPGGPELGDLRSPFARAATALPEVVSSAASGMQAPRESHM
jgi:hypothetical protein